tara:strand:+ start:533 stop:2971 length:2439 start_codon:yes stop_codon:yes gene_type:complete
MAIIRLTDDNFERFELVANPVKTFSSSSLGITGSVSLFADASPSMKDIEPSFAQASGKFNDSQLSSVLDDIIASASATGHGSLEAKLSEYLSLVTSTTSSYKLTKKQEILRFTPGVTFDTNFLRKRAVKETLFPYYRNVYPTAQWSYTNYNSLNFVTGGNLPTDSVLIYPAGTGAVAQENFNPLAPSSSFTFDFYINPRYTTPNVGDEFKAGTIFHMSSCYALSLVTGSSIGLDGKTDGYRLLLQLSASANITPSTCLISGDTITTSIAGQDTTMLFASTDNSLTKNTWHHVAVRWGGPNVNSGTGSFVIDGTEDKTFEIAASSVMQASSSGVDLLDPDALFVGNYYIGDNYGANAIAQFFNPAAHAQEGVALFNDKLPSTDPLVFSFTHPLNAEIHDLKIYDHFRNDEKIAASSKRGSTLESGLKFYVPPFFQKDTRVRNVLQTPFFDARGSTEDPFNVALSFGVGGLCVNLENFTKDLVTKQFPRLMTLTASRIDTSVQTPRTCNFLLYESGSTRKRNLTIVPCDNGKFFPNFSLLEKEPQMGVANVVSGTLATSTYTGSFDSRFVDDFGNKNFSFVSLRDMVDTSNLLPQIPDTDESKGSLLAPLMGATPEDPGVSPGNILTVLERQHDPSSNEVVFFDVSNMFYGDRIEPGTVIIEDLAVSGSGDRMTFKLKDNEHGNLYRADSVSPHATWSSVGNVLYEEGIIVIKTPHMPFFGKDSFKIQFSGDRSVYTLEILIPAGPSLLNSSSNPTYQELAPSNYSSETAEKFTYLTGINLHDNNLNIIARAHVAQPIIKREDDRMVVRLRMDF